MPQRESSRPSAVFAELWPGKPDLLFADAAASGELLVARLRYVILGVITVLSTALVARVQRLRRLSTTDRLDEAKRGGRDRVVGPSPEVAGPGPALRSESLGPLS